MNYTQNFENPDLQPYADGECRHEGYSTRKGVTKCLNCGAVYDEQLMEWRSEDAE